ncbi:BrnT family toxin [Candidatus Riflebacteria bacterium]
MENYRIGFFVFEWDDDKNKENIKKHSVSFEDAATLWLRPELTLDLPDDRFAYGENRWIAFGPDENQRLLVVAYTDRDSFLRLISARSAEKPETKAYYKTMEERNEKE